MLPTSSKSREVYYRMQNVLERRGFIKYADVSDDCELWASDLAGHIVVTVIIDEARFNDPVSAYIQAIAKNPWDRGVQVYRNTAWNSAGLDNVLASRYDFHHHAEPLEGTEIAYDSGMLKDAKCQSCKMTVSSFYDGTIWGDWQH